MNRVAHFRVLGRIGAGGMGEVYRARDERLQWDVTINVTSAAQAADTSLAAGYAGGS